MMRIEVVQKPPIVSIDGIRLDCFEPGQRYEVGNSIGALFLAEGWAVPLPLDEPQDPDDLSFSQNEAFNPRPLNRDDPSNLRRESSPPYLSDVAADFKWRRGRRT